MVSNRSRSNSPDCADSCFIKISNCGSAAESDIRAFLVGIDVKATDKKDSGAMLVQLADAAAAKSALAFDQKTLNGNQVQIRLASSKSSIGSSGPKEQAALRMQGLPFKATDEDIEEFFQGYNMVPGSVKYQINEETERKTGHAAVLFESQEDADRAFKEKQKQEIGGRWILLNDCDVEDHAEFETFSLENKNVRCGDSVNEDNVDRCVKIRGLPWAANKNTVIDFFEGFKIKKSDVVIDIQCGKNSGFAVVVLPNEEEAERACSELDKKTIGNRWIGVSPAELRRGGGGRRQEAEAY